MKDEILEKTKQWLNKAGRDIEAGEILLERGLYDYSLFHSQQAIEKFLKAFLTFHNRPFGKTHNVKKLARLCMEIDGEFEYVNEAGAGELYPKSIEVRYPTDYEPTKEEAEEALETAKKVREFILKKLGIQ